jgi:hypothetical protein
LYALQVFAIQLGSFVGSALIPVSHPKYPRTTLLSAACAMVLFVAGFGIALRRGLFAIGFIPLAFVMQMYAGWVVLNHVTITVTVTVIVKQAVADRCLWHVVGRMPYHAQLDSGFCHQIA